MSKSKINLQRIINYFTDDAWYLIEAFFSKLQKKLIESQVPERKQDSILKGLEDFLYEYIEDHKGREKIINKSRVTLQNADVNTSLYRSSR